MQQNNFIIINNYLLSNISYFLAQWLPSGRKIGNEYKCGSLQGEPGKSLCINMQTGKWSDFATGESGGDLISLYAGIYSLSQGDALKKLADLCNISITAENKKIKPMYWKKPPPKKTKPVMRHRIWGEPSSCWEYTDKSGNPLFYIARYESSGKKQFCPWSWDFSRNCWIPKGFPAPRPLYNLPNLLSETKPILIVEGEKAADAASSLVGNTYTVTTWASGARAWTQSDFSVLEDRTIVLWPDNDAAGISAMHSLSAVLKKQNCVAILDVSSFPHSFDAADALQDGWTHQRTIDLLGHSLDSLAKVDRTSSHYSVAVLDELPEPSEALFETYRTLGLNLTRSGSPVPNMDNVIRILQTVEHFQKNIWFDTFHQNFYTTWPTGRKRIWEEHDFLLLTLFIQRQLGMSNIVEANVRQGFLAFARTNTKNEPKDWMDSLQWDKVPRVELFAVDALSSEDNEYTRAVSKNFWVSMVARIFSPGCKADNMVILEGPQGSKKSSVLAAIGGDWFSEISEDPGSKDFLIALQGKLLLEVAELDSFYKADFNTIKKMLSCRSDRFRMPYSRTIEEFPRSCIFAGSTNDFEYIKDQTGGRRFWPISVGKIDLDYINTMREQLFAEAVYLYKNKTTWWEMPYSTSAEQEKRRASDAWEATLQEWLNQNKHEASQKKYLLSSIASSVFGVSIDRLEKRTQMRIAQILRRVGATKELDRRTVVWTFPSECFLPEE